MVPPLRFSLKNRYSKNKSRLHLPMRKVVRQFLDFSTGMEQRVTSATAMRHSTQEIFTTKHTSRGTMHRLPPDRYSHLRKRTSVPATPVTAMPYLPGATDSSAHSRLQAITRCSSECSQNLPTRAPSPIVPALPQASKHSPNPMCLLVLRAMWHDKSATKSQCFSGSLTYSPFSTLKSVPTISPIQNLCGVESETVRMTSASV